MRNYFLRDSDLVAERRGARALVHSMLRIIAAWAFACAVLLILAALLLFLRGQDAPINQPKGDPHHVTI